MTDVKDTGPLDWRIAITDKGGRPTPEFQRRWNTQRGNNALIGSITLGSGPPTGVPGDGAEYVDISSVPFTIYIGSGGTWHKASVTDFTDLQDVPNAYMSAADHLVRVNAGETGLEFVDQGTLAANPSATAGPTAINGTADTFMRSDAAPAVQVGSDTQLGLLQVDGTTITAVAGVITSIGGGGGGGSWLPLVSGSEPPIFITDGAGVLITVGYAP